MGGAGSLLSSYIPIWPAYVCSDRIYNVFAVAGLRVVCDGCNSPPSGISQPNVFNGLNALAIFRHLSGVSEGTLKVPTLSWAL